MSICDLLAVLYGKVMRVNPQEPNMEQRDRFICSKGHAGPAVYAALALKGYFPLEMLKTLNRLGTNLPSHCDRNLTPGVDMTTGSLGQGLSVSVGVALGNRLKGMENDIFVVLGDGECQEGQVWEAAMAAAQYNLSHLIAFIDYNKLQINGTVESVNNITNFCQRFQSFYWNTELVDGHDVDAIYSAICRAKNQKERPSLIVLDTIKGYGCKYALAHSPRNHSIPMPEAELEESLSLLEDELIGYERILKEG